MIYGLRASSFEFTFLLFVSVINHFSDAGEMSQENKRLMRLHRYDPIVGKGCQISKNQTGQCRSFFDCEDVIIPGVDPDSRICKWVGGIPIVCCSIFAKASAENETTIRSATYVSPPVLSRCMDYSCGYPYGLPPINAYDKNGKHDIYYLNKTAVKLRRNGYSVQINEVFSDAIRKLTYTKGKQNGTMYFDKIDGVSPVGGRPAIRERSYYMALLGERRMGGTSWYCDGVLLNRQWVLTAAHCFVRKGVSLNVIRLGEIDWSKTAKQQTDNNPEDFTIQKLVLHPFFKPSSRYHDLALIKLDRPIAKMQHSMNPICLPWGNEVSSVKVGSKLVLSGWGSTSYRSSKGKKTHVLQEVELTVFNTSFCDKNYSKLRDYKQKWSHGMMEQTTLCAGSKQGGKDACSGDSGAPLVYQNKKKSLMLAGIVSAGFGCGLKDFPGIYIPINNPQYLKWIKEVAFAEC